MEFKMKKRTLRRIAFVLVVCLVIPSFLLWLEQLIMPLCGMIHPPCVLRRCRFLFFSSTHLAECKGTISLYSQYRSGTIDASLALWKSSDRKTWSIDKSWDYNGPGYDGTTDAFPIIRNRYVVSGYYYKVTFTVDVYDSNGTYIETLRAASSVLFMYNR